MVCACAHAHVCVCGRGGGGKFGRSKFSVGTVNE